MKWFNIYQSDVLKILAFKCLKPEEVETLTQTKLYWPKHSSYGKTITNKRKHRNIKYCDAETVSQEINHGFFHKLNVTSEDSYEVEHFKKSVIFDLPIQIGFYVYGYAKLRMLEFYYDFLEYYIDRRDFETLEMDTDSLYFALSTPNLEDVIKSEKKKKKEFYSNYHKWLPAEVYPTHREEFISKRSQGQPFSPYSCCIAQQKFDKRTSGLYKL